MIGRHSTNHSTYVYVSACLAPNRLSSATFVFVIKIIHFSVKIEVITGGIKTNIAYRGTRISFVMNVYTDAG